MSATIKDIAQRTGLGLATISKYLNGGNVLEKNRIAIEAAIKELDYTVNEFARGLKTQRSRTIGVIIPELSNVFVTNIITEMEDVLRNRGYSVIVTDCRTDERLEQEAVEFMMAKRVDGIICMPVSRQGDFLRPAMEQNIPVILIDRLLEGLETDVVMIDNASASEKAVTHLIQQGHTQIGIVVGPEGIYTSEQRLKGYKDALQQRNIEVHSDHIEYSNYTVQGGYESMKSMLQNNRNMTAVFMTNYEMTLGAIIAVNEMNVRIPEDLSFIGFDNLQLSQIVRPKLTIVEQPLHLIGRNAADLILKRLQEKKAQPKQRIQLMTTLIERDSVAKIG